MHCYRAIGHTPYFTSHSLPLYQNTTTTIAIAALVCVPNQYTMYFLNLIIVELLHVSLVFFTVFFFGSKLSQPIQYCCHCSPLSALNTCF